MQMEQIQAGSRKFWDNSRRLGSKIQSGEFAAEAAQTLKDARLEAEASYSGVNLDTEASKLIELQQAYQASARILSTARDLFDTLIQSV